MVFGVVCIACSVILFISVVLWQLKIELESKILNKLFDEIFPLTDDDIRLHVLNNNFLGYLMYSQRKLNTEMYNTFRCKDVITFLHNHNDYDTIRSKLTNIKDDINSRYKLSLDDQNFMTSNIEDVIIYGKNAYELYTHYMNYIERQKMNENELESQ